MRGLRRLRAGVPGRGHLLRGRCARRVERLHKDQRRLLRRARFTRRGIDGGYDRERPAISQGRRVDRTPESTLTAGRDALPTIDDLAQSSSPSKRLAPQGAGRAVRGGPTLRPGVPLGASSTTNRPRVAVLTDAGTE